MSKLILGIDPGVTGAFALIDAASGAYVHVNDMPVVSDQSLSWVDGAELQTLLLSSINGRPAIAVIERVSAMPQQGVSSTFKFGVAVGSILGTVQTLRIPLHLIHSSQWKRALGLTFEKDVKQAERKRASLDKARLLFPTAPLDRQKDNGRAEALLIAHWYLQNRVGAKAA
ncbi:MAG TPA: hypothetical protein VGD45_20550 [Steroidobacter sp.]|uniref:hypothetical protein n=1 Tax=Steroidobacter sp. TaxID=1978227 RepID=UPI002ED77975